MPVVRWAFRVDCGRTFSLLVSLMTIVLGVGIGHDASAAVLRDGVVVAHVLRERHSGCRHHLGIDRATIERLTSPKNYLGLAREMVDRVLAARVRTE